MVHGGFTSQPIRIIHVDKRIPISDFVALEQIDLCHEWAGNVLGRSYCLQVGNTLMYPLTADVPANR